MIKSFLNFCFFDKANLCQLKSNSNLNSSAKVISKDVFEYINTNMDDNMKLLVNYFNNSSINSNINTKNYLYNSDFKNGTFRITKPGTYIIGEDIIFNPNETNNFMPLESQNNQYLHFSIDKNQLGHII